MKKENDITNDVLIADALLRIKTIENLLISKGVFTKDEFQDELEAVAKKIAKSLLQKAGIPGEIDDLLRALGQKPKAGN